MSWFCRDIIIIIIIIIISIVTGLRVNVGNTKILVSVHNAPKPVDGSKFPCGVCNKGVGINSIMPVAFGAQTLFKHQGPSKT